MSTAAATLPASIAAAPAWAMGMTYLAAAGSMGLAMGNAIACQQRGQVLAGAATALVIALILVQGATGAATGGPSSSGGGGGQ